MSEISPGINDALSKPINEGRQKTETEATLERYQGYLREEKKENQRLSFGNEENNQAYYDCVEAVDNIFITSVLTEDKSKTIRKQIIPFEKTTKEVKRDLVTDPARAHGEKDETVDVIDKVTTYTTNFLTPSGDNGKLKLDIHTYRKRNINDKIELIFVLNDGEKDTYKEEKGYSVVDVKDAAHEFVALYNKHQK